MKFSELIQTIQDIVRRPDLMAYTASRAHTAVSLVHAVANFDRDLVEITETVAAPAAIGTVMLPQDLRLLKEAVPVGADGKLGAPLRIVSVAELMKLRQCGKDSGTAYVVNGALSFNSPAVAHGMLFVGYAQRMEPSIRYDSVGATGADSDWETVPEIGNYTTWLMREYPAAFIDYATGYLELAQGNTEQGRYLLNMFQTVHAPYLHNLANHATY